VIVRLIDLSTEHLLQVDSLAVTFLPTATLRINDVPNINPQVRLENLRASIDFLLENGPHFVEIVGHAHVMIADSGQSTDYRAPRFVDRVEKDSLGVFLAESGDGVSPIDADHKPPVGQRLASDPQGISNVTHVDGVVTVQELP